MSVNLRSPGPHSPQGNLCQRTQVKPRMQWSLDQLKALLGPLPQYLATKDLKNKRGLYSQRFNAQTTLALYTIVGAQRYKASARVPNFLTFRYWSVLQP